VSPGALEAPESTLSEGMGVQMHSDIQEIVLTEERIRERIAEIGAQISGDYGDEPVLMIAVLRGAALFIADLSRQISSPIEIDFMAVSSYGSSTKSSGVVRIIKDLEEDIEGRHVLVVEDILDTGLTLKYLLKNLASRKPKSLEVCTLLSKDGKQRVPISCKYIGFEVPDEFVVGYGLDYAERYRNLPYIGVLKPAIYTD
jgi:hypoxanthine phosphoribosyltransferase